MSFLNIALLGGVLAFLAPALIHLLNRSRFQSVDWGAMQLLESAMQVNSRRWQWESILLLLIRCLIPILFAICLARPVLTSVRIAGLGDQKAMHFLIDDSLSAAGTTGSNRFQDSVREIERIAAANPKAVKSMQLLSGAESPLIGSTADTVRFQKALAEVMPAAGSSRAMPSLLAAVERIREASSNNKHLIVASDFRASDWATIEETQWLKLQEGFADADTPIQLTFLSQEVDPAVGNLSVRFANPSDFVAPRGLPKRIRVLVETSGSISQEDTQCELFVDGKSVASKLVALDRGAQQQVSFDCEFGEFGWHTVSARIQDQQGFAGDNRSELAIWVRESLSVLQVRQDSQSGSSSRDVDFLELALMPFSSAYEGKNTFAVRTVRASALSRTLRSEQPNVVVLNDVPSFAPQVAQQLEEYIASGNGLVVLAGGNLRTDWYRDRWAANSEFLPMVYAPEVETDAPLGVLRQRLEVSELELFNASDAGDLFALEFQQWLPMLHADSVGDRRVPKEQIATELASYVVMRFSDGSPCVVSRSFGAGQIVQCAFSVSETWSNLPKKPVFVPLMQQLMWLASRTLRSPNVIAGERLRVLHSNSAEQLEYELNAEGTGQTLVAQLESEGTSSIRPTRPGSYLIKAQGGASADMSFDGQVDLPLFSVALDPAESSVAVWPTQERQEVLELLGAAEVQDAEGFQAAADLRQSGQEIWRWFLAGLIALLFAEILLGRLVTKGNL